MAEVVQVLNDNYGAERDAKKDLGGFVVFVEYKKEWRDLKELFCVDFKANEYKEEIEDSEFVEMLFVLSSDYVLDVFMHKKCVKSI